MKLPYKYTICPPGPEPKRPTASCPEMGRLLKGGDDLTIDQRRRGAWQSWLEPMRDKPFEERLAETIAKATKGRP